MKQLSDSGCESSPAEIKEEGCEEGNQWMEDGDSAAAAVCAASHAALRTVRGAAKEPGRLETRSKSLAKCRRVIEHTKNYKSSFNRPVRRLKRSTGNRQTATLNGNHGAMRTQGSVETKKNGQDIKPLFYLETFCSLLGTKIDNCSSEGQI